MSYPAYASIAAHPDLTLARWRVWMFLQPPRHSHTHTHDEKVATVQLALKMSPNSVVDALDWLTALGALVEHGRDKRGVRSLTLGWALAKHEAA